MILWHFLRTDPPIKFPPMILPAIAYGINGHIVHFARAIFRDCLVLLSDHVQER